ncbi:MAG: sugar ABC transporter permease, partial [Staphylococcus lugdunensis]|nr:sugar ABC transporter permease [Staphylococcus lugdunensis]
MKETLHVNHAHPVKQHKVTLLQRIWQHKVLYLMLLPCLLFFLIFNYIPMA